MIANKLKIISHFNFIKLSWFYIFIGREYMEYFTFENSLITLKPVLGIFNFIIFIQTEVDPSKYIKIKKLD